MSERRCTRPSRGIAAFTRREVARLRKLERKRKRRVDGWHLAQVDATPEQPDTRAPDAQPDAQPDAPSEAP